MRLDIFGVLCTLLGNPSFSGCPGSPSPLWERICGPLALASLLTWCPTGIYHFLQGGSFRIPAVFVLPDTRALPPTRISIVSCCCSASDSWSTWSNKTSSLSRCWASANNGLSSVEGGVYACNLILVCTVILRCKILWKCWLLIVTITTATSFIHEKLV